MTALELARGPLTEGELDDWYAVPDDADPGARWVRGSFIATLDGRVTGPDGLSGGLNEGSAGDHAAFGTQRRWAQAVVVGAGTARSEGYGPLEGCLLVVVTRSGKVPESLRDHPDVLVVGGDGDEVTPARVLEAVGERGLHRVVVDGGPALFGAWVAAGAVDELCLTVRPVIAGGEGPSLLPADVRLPELLGRATHLLEWEGDLLLRLRLGA
ncbi:5-amino-6-(5-phosphoribosylamino)uracil reductase [Serinicoccus hydrothermalis]|uniref:5-amino-6-(5-phosphoribosylamino)uracil reductase n=1 Tax=Serinicoccus hydrothermalis TaxID=1758689 RepID=A0A1B1N915_9MICO|nr:dihydrofolate reductase family protein [Serinicoccus hydrothermalis]ANS77908.1 5-amino-6-(5-phosphoribosylamino)uracil reductase [Serinicoccus hydrothermalis]